MKLCFSIDALSASGAQAWRLQSDESWRECIYSEPLKDGDMRITDKKTAEHWSGRRLEKDKDLVLVPKKKAGTFDFLMRGTFAHAVLHRDSSAPIPDKAQMLACIAALNPGTPWLLYLTVAGHFTALDSSNTPMISNLDIAVRGEIASSGDYIGPRACRNEKMMSELYLQFLAGWLDHLNSSNMNVFVPDAEKLKNEEDYADAIRNWKPT